MNLAKFVTIYKLVLMVQRRVNGGKERDLDSLVAGGLGGWWVFGDRTPVSIIDLCILLGLVVCCGGHPNVLEQYLMDIDQRTNRPLRPLPRHPLPHPASLLPLCRLPKQSRTASLAPSTSPHLAPGQPKADPTGVLAIRYHFSSELGGGDVHV